jgi:hypothetical protein
MNRRQRRRAWLSPRPPISAAKRQLACFQKTSRVRVVLGCRTPLAVRCSSLLPRDPRTQHNLQPSHTLLSSCLSRRREAPNRSQSRALDTLSSVHSAQELARRSATPLQPAFATPALRHCRLRRFNVCERSSSTPRLAALAELAEVWQETIEIWHPPIAPIPYQPASVASVAAALCEATTSSAFCFCRKTA